MKRALSAVVLGAILFATVSIPSRASAGGFYLMDRGVRAAGRGSAFVAGADDPASLYYNPAGLAYSGDQLLFDAALPLMQARYTRVDSGGNTLPTVEMSQVPLAIPSAAISNNFGLEKLNFGLGVWAPNAALSIWPDSVNVNGQAGPAPQRYSLIDLRGSLITTMGVGISYRPIEQLSFGATVGITAGSFAATTTMSSCDGAICTQPENPEYDALTQFNLPMFVAPHVSVGAIGHFGRIRIGASFDTPFTIKGTANLRVRVPSAAIYENARVEAGDGGAPTAGVNIPFAWVLRTGAEVRPVDQLRLEAGVEIQGWKRQQDIRITPNDVYLRDVLAVGDYQVGPVTIPRHMRNTVAIRAGGEYSIGIVTLRGGLQYETGAFSSRYLNAMTLDSDKVIISGGIGIEVSRGIHLDGVLAYSAMRDVTVRDSAVPQPNPIRPEASEGTYIGNGRYEMSALLIGGGLRVNFDARRAPTNSPEAANADSEPASYSADEPATAPAPAPAPVVATPAPAPAPGPSTGTAAELAEPAPATPARPRRTPRARPRPH